MTENYNPMTFKEETFTIKFQFPKSYMKPLKEHCLKISSKKAKETEEKPVGITEGKPMRIGDVAYTAMLMYIAQVGLIPEIEGYNDPESK